MIVAVAVYCVGVGTLMVGWWVNDLRHRAWQRADRTHPELLLHLAAEFATACWLLASGITSCAGLGYLDALGGWPSAGGVAKRVRT
jgi:hypothetical protein